jgi:hypothetical protein
MPNISNMLILHKIKNIADRGVLTPPKETLRQR